MKTKITKLILAATLLLLINPSLFAQDETFQIKKPFKRSTFNGVELKDLSNKELKSILSKDPLSIKKFKAGNVNTTCATIMLCIGSGLLLYETSLQSQNINGGIRKTDNTLSSVGLGIIATSIPFYILGNSLRKSAIKGFRVSSEKNVSMKITPSVLLNQSIAGGISICVFF